MTVHTAAVPIVRGLPVLGSATRLLRDPLRFICSLLKERFPALRGPTSDDICYATTNRQDALTAIAEESDLVLVVGSTNSSNSVRLVELAHRHDTPSYLIDDPSHIRPEWLFDSPRDVLLFDTGHQAYVHKILTGRCAEFDSLRQAGGLSGYPSRAESVHDAQALASAGADTCAVTYALPPRFLLQASCGQILRAHGLDAPGIATAVLKRLASTHRGKVTFKEM
jgi:hypothetical protein